MKYDSLTALEFAAVGLCLFALWAFVSAAAWAYYQLEWRQTGRWARLLAAARQAWKDLLA